MIIVVVQGPSFIPQQHGPGSFHSGPLGPADIRSNMVQESASRPSQRYAFRPSMCFLTWMLDLWLWKTFLTQNVEVFFFLLFQRSQDTFQTMLSVQTKTTRNPHCHPAGNHANLGGEQLGTSGPWDVNVRSQQESLEPAINTSRFQEIRNRTFGTDPPGPLKKTRLSTFPLSTYLSKGGWGVDWGSF